MHFIIGLIVVAIIIYAAFLRKPGESDEETFKKIAQTVVIVFILLVLGIAVVVMLDK
jgi:hypothetical protein